MFWSCFSSGIYGMADAVRVYAVLCETGANWSKRVLIIKMKLGCRLASKACARWISVASDRDVSLDVVAAIQRARYALTGRSGPIF